MSYKSVDLAKLGIDTSIRFFARPVRVELACPRCDRVQVLGQGTSRRIWDPRVARFECMGCHAIYHLGIVAWRAGHGAYKTPADQMPTVKQALQLRQQLSVHLAVKLMRGRETNVLDELPPLVDAGRLDVGRRKA